MPLACSRALAVLAALAAWAAPARGVVIRDTHDSSQGDRGEGPGAPARLEVTHPHVAESAAFALSELRLLSESGIYETLSLDKIHYAANQVGAFHNNTYLTLELSSPHLLHATSSLHDVIVMADLEDGVRSFAIDEFPVMDGDAIEQFWIRKVMETKREREALFRQLEEEAEAYEAQLGKMAAQRSVSALGELHAEAAPGR
ncbi:hypothetical protein FNF27_01723 [Cafeteria roenbergensis]|uniref:Uncharacterized protein n=1 Tax=Cafeteria roenbergensis TaxID=33653 RepID=A0A5A8EMB3_CAFRO|nr:hypothetical protein FNF31_00687 [Cafeteria roenbergensis]KAA0176901.1 hypothetical protein FNF27_01723 [Cafeteria roenbergensis]